MKNNKMVGMMVGALVVGVGGGFYGGMHYAQKTAQDTRGQFANLSPEERQARMAQVGGTGVRAGARGGAIGGGMVMGEVISKDAQGITVKLPDGGSKIVFMSGSTGVMKTASGTPEDIAVGTQVSVSGTANPDGSVSAQTVQIRPKR
jgi:hypothetical protein